MPWVGNIPENPSFAQKLGRGAGQGLGEGLSEAVNRYIQRKEKEKIIDKINKMGSEEKKKDSRRKEVPRDRYNLEGKFGKYTDRIAHELGMDMEGESLDESQKQGLIPRFLEQMQEQTPYGTESFAEEEIGVSPSMREKQRPSSDHLFKQAEALIAAGMEKEGALRAQQAKAAQREELTERERQEKYKQFPIQEQQKQEAQRTSEFIKKVDQIKDDQPTTQFALQMMSDALDNAGGWAAAKDLMADKTGYEGFRSASGAALDSAIKSYFIGDLTSIKGGRPNVFIEKQIRSAYPKAGLDPIANQKIMVGLQLKEKINNSLVNETQKIRDHYMKKQRYLPAGFKEMVYEKIRPQVEKYEKDSISTLKNLSDIESQRDQLLRTKLMRNEVLMMSPEGKPFAANKKEVAALKEQGYINVGKK